GQPRETKPIRGCCMLIRSQSKQKKKPGDFTRVCGDSLLLTQLVRFCEGCRTVKIVKGWINIDPAHNFAQKMSLCLICD
ncbi:hypothetical protein, partial [Pseudescherichia sp.]|uniref:hypothetical protein n=1 Tax=Pseudescherichia sp. TaxID=2055881 RepID=UPI0028ACDCC4